MSTLADKANTSNRKTFKAHDRPSFECIALLLQVGGALGAYQAGSTRRSPKASPRLA
jgi:hypothetical protein